MNQCCKYVCCCKYIVQMCQICMHHEYADVAGAKMQCAYVMAYTLQVEWRGMREWGGDGQDEKGGGNSAPCMHVHVHDKRLQLLVYCHHGVVGGMLV